jgi:DNA helicase-2/ATP-dependent DNA helicase PcrA
LFDKGIHPGLKKISAVLEKLISDASNSTLQQLFSNIIQNAGIIPYIIGHKNKIELLQLLTGFFNFIKEETSRNPYMQLNELMNIIEVMEKEKLPLPLLQIAGNEKGVNLLTAHGSKGLEFEYVFFAGVNASAWEKKRKPAGGYKLPDTMFASAGDNKLIEEEELRRLFYVALTRAEKYLYISYPLFKNDGKLLEPSMFIAEILQQHPLTTQNVSLSKETLFDFEILQYTATAPEIDSSETDFIDGILSKFVMNVTALNNYLDCPLGFYYKNLIRIPTGKSEATEFGSAIHYALEQLFKNMLTNNNKAFDPIEKVVSNFNWYIERHRENFTKEAFNRRIEQGSIILPAYYNTYVQSWNKVVAVERNIRGVMVGDVPLKGKLDKLEFDGNNVNVVDYKSGDIDKALAKMKGPNDKEPNGGGYWRQAVFYKILVDNYNQKNWNVVSTEFDYVEPDKNKQYRKEKIVISPADIETVKQQIQQTWQKIQDKAFYTGCGKADCQWCNFVKDNQLAIELHPIDDAEEE